MIFTTKAPDEWRTRFAVIPVEIGKRGGKPLWLWWGWYEWKWNVDTTIRLPATAYIRRVFIAGEEYQAHMN